MAGLQVSSKLVWYGHCPHLRQLGQTREEVTRLVELEHPELKCIIRNIEGQASADNRNIKEPLNLSGMDTVLN